MQCQPVVSVVVGTLCYLGFAIAGVVYIRAHWKAMSRNAKRAYPKYGPAQWIWELLGPGFGRPNFFGYYRLVIAAIVTIISISLILLINFLWIYSLAVGCKS